MNDETIPDTHEDGEIVDVREMPVPLGAVEEDGELSSQVTVKVTGWPQTPPETSPPARPALDRIQACERECAKAANRAATTKAEAELAKDAYDEAVERLRSAVRASEQPELPFTDAEKTDPDPENDDGADWRGIPLREALHGISDALLTRLAEAQLETMGALADFTSKQRLTDLKGVGTSKAEAIEKACEDFWTRRKAVGGDPESETTEAGE